MTATENISLRGYHATDSVIERLDYAHLLQHINDHDNGGLGLWCSFNPDWIGSFGSRVYEVAVDGKPYDMSIDELAQLSQTYRGVEDYTRLRNKLLLDGYHLIRILEVDGRCGMFVVLDFDQATLKLAEN